MLSRRVFVNCALCAITPGFAATAVQAQGQPAQTSGVTRNILSTTELPDGKYVTVQVVAEIAPGATVARHTHPGIESAYVLEGEAELLVDGKGTVALAPGTGVQVPAGTPHSVKNGPKATRLAIVYTVEKDKPLASPA